MTSLSFTHRYEPALTGGLPPLLLLHGTGGSEDDLLPLGRAISPGSALLSPRGRVLEHGMPRFFRRLAEGVFDEEDVKQRANELADFVAEAREAYGLGELTAIGFSNGANIAAAMLLLRPEAIRSGIFLRAMVPLSEPPVVDLTGKRVLLLSGAVDPIVPPENSRRLAAILREANAEVYAQALPASHGLTPQDVSLSQQWMAKDAQPKPL